MLENLQVVLRFHYGRRGSVNHIISQTMGRVAVINHAYQGQMPQPESFWLCRIDREHNKSADKGCFVVTPMHSVSEDKILRLIPGAYDTETYGNTLICKPKIANQYWIVPFSIKKFFLKKDKAKVLYQGVVVPVQIDAIPTA